MQAKEAGALFFLGSEWAKQELNAPQRSIVCAFMPQHDGYLTSLRIFYRFSIRTFPVEPWGAGLSRNGRFNAKFYHLAGGHICSFGRRLARGIIFAVSAAPPTLQPPYKTCPSCVDISIGQY
jgi:hypothetical protein